MAPTSPTVASWELSIRIRNRRHELKMDQGTVAKALGFTRNYWSMVENDRAILAEDRFDKLLDLFDWKPDERAELQAMWEGAHQRGWWEDYRDLLPEELRRVQGLEYGAEIIHSYEALVISGLLQTEEYAQAVMGDDPSVSRVERERYVEVRLKRQERLTPPDPVRLTTLMSEAALHQRPTTLKGDQILRRQLGHLIEMIESLGGNLTVRIAPFSRGLGGLTSVSTLFLFDFSQPELPRAVWQESGRAWGFTDDEPSITHAKVSYEQALATSLGREASLDLIEKALQDLGRS